MRQLLIPFICIFLTGCVTTSLTRKPGNLTPFVLNAGYQSAYRIIDENLKRCFPAGYVQSTIYPDQQRANITVASNLTSTVWFLMDIKDDGKGASAVDYYSIYPRAGKDTARFQGWVNEGKTECS